jgi:hypothetical protein
VHLPDQVRVVAKEPGRPQPVSKVGAAPLELGGEPAVDGQVTAEAISHVRRTSG